MTITERSESIIRKFKGFEMPNEEIASIQCAIIYVKGIIDEVNEIHFRFIMDNEKTRKHWEGVLTCLNDRLRYSN